MPGFDSIRQIGVENLILHPLDQFTAINRKQDFHPSIEVAHLHSERFVFPSPTGNREPRRDTASDKIVTS